MGKIIISIFLILPFFLFSEDLPNEEIQVNLNGYFDNYEVKIIYPTISMTRNISSTTSINARYLIDIISAASMKSHFDSVYSFVNKKYSQTKEYGIVDAYTSATPKGHRPNDNSLPHGGGDQTPDELRHEMGLGITQLIYGPISISINGIYSSEHDYDSKTIAGNINIPVAGKNSIFGFGAVKSWDKNYPQTRLWTEKKDVLSLSGSFTQIFSTSLLGQVELFYSKANGFLSDPYQIIQVRNINLVDSLIDYAGYYEPIYPSSRNRFAFGTRGIYQLLENGSLTLGYRYYSDDWGIKSQTASIQYQHLLFDDMIKLGFSWRYYTQTKADFFKQYFTKLDIANGSYMAVDSKLNALYSNEIEFNFNMNGKLIPFIDNEKFEYRIGISVFQRYTDTPDWHSRKQDLYALIFSTGIKYLFN